jgi:hypothetical protein
MSIIFQVTNINQNMHIPAHIISEHIASMKFADEFTKIQEKEKKDKVEEVKKVEEANEIDENNTKEKKRHIDLKG